MQKLEIAIYYIVQRV